MAQSRFDHIDGKPDEDQVCEWADQFFFNLLNTLNSFYAQVEFKNAGERLRSVPFDKLVAEQLTGESDEVLGIAIGRVRELLDNEVEFLDAYSG
jgi:hypothetical protein